MCDRIRNQLPSWRILISINVVLHLLTALPLVAQTAEERGRTIAQEAGSTAADSPYAPRWDNRVSLTARRFF